MEPFVRVGSDVLVGLDSQTAGWLVSLAEQLIELLEGEDFEEPAAPPEDPFQAWAQEFDSDDLDIDDEADPVMHRLFPDAYPNDPAASYDFRRYTQHSQRRSKISDAETMIDDLLAAAREHGCVLSQDHQGAWLKTLNNLRLVLAVRLGIDDEEAAQAAHQLSDTHPLAWHNAVYQYLSALQSELLEVLE